jgi:hypothetical protein
VLAAVNWRPSRRIAETPIRNSVGSSGLVGSPARAPKSQPSWLVSKARINARRSMRKISSGAAAIDTIY